MEDGTLRKLELYLHDLHKKIDGIYDMLMLRHERETEQKGSSAINEKLLDNQDLCLLFQISPRSLQRYRSLGVLPYKRLGQKTYYTEEDVMQFVENNVKEFKKENVEHPFLWFVKLSARIFLAVASDPANYHYDCTFSQNKANRCLSADSLSVLVYFRSNTEFCSLPSKLSIFSAFHS